MREETPGREGCVYALCPLVSNGHDFLLFLVSDSMFASQHGK